MDIIQIDDVISRLYQDRIEAEVTSNKVPWFFGGESDRPSQSEVGFDGFRNTPFDANEPTPASSSLTALLLPVLYVFCDKARLPFTSLLRIRLGLFPRAMIDVPHHTPCVDFHVPHKTALYYVNESDGDIVIFNETFERLHQDRSLAYMRENQLTVGRRIAPRKGRMIGFDGSHYHASMHPAKHASRIVVTFSFV